MSLKKNNNIYVQNNRIERDKSTYSTLGKLTKFLADNEWLKAGNTSVLEDFDIKNELGNEPLLGDKPLGTWWSKGGWFFADLCCKTETKILYAQIDYSNIFSITGKDKLSDPMTDKIYQEKIKEFDKKYIAKKAKNGWFPNGTHMYSCNDRVEQYCDSELNMVTEKKKCKWNKKTQKCNLINKNQCYKSKKNCSFKYGFAKYDWTKLIKKYDGFAIYPYMTKEFMIKYQKHLTFTSYDVESLVLFNKKPIIAYHYLGTVKEIMDSVSNNKSKSKSKKTVVNHADVDDNKFINGIIKKIKEIRKTL
jgi:hypothetical protein